jgi:phosphoglycerate kinase
VFSVVKKKEKRRMAKLRLQDLDLKGKKVLMRVDFNVPLNKDGTVADDTRIKESLPSIQHILKAGGSVILMSHLGRPKGAPDPKFSLAPCAKVLSTLLGQPVLMADDCIGKKTEDMARTLQPGQVLLLENLRFHAAEEKPSLDPSFAKKLASLGDLYINDAFGTAHRAHASTVAIAQYFPGKSAAGLLMQKEIAALSTLLNPQRPFYAMIGGAKISSKMEVLKSLLTKADGILIGGGMAFTFFLAQGLKIGSSIHEDDQVPVAKDFLEECRKKNIPCWLPKDVVIADAFEDRAQSKIVAPQQGIPNGWQGMDIGPKTIEEWGQVLKKGKTIFWNGPLGVFEFPRFALGTEQIAKTLSTLKGATTIVGGGDSVAAVNRLGLAKAFTHVSTGGGASLEFIEFGHLPGIDALSEKNNI